MPAGDRPFATPEATTLIVDRGTTAMAVADRRIHLRPPSIVGSVIGTYDRPKVVGLRFVHQ